MTPARTHTPPHTLRGFSLIELLVSLAIMSFITGVALFNHGKFNNSLALTNLAYEVALGIREAQVYGVSVRSATGSQFVSYGIWFSNSTPTQYSLFADINGNQRLDTGEQVQVAQITQGNRIGNFCGTAGGGTVCAGTLSEFGILFTRPNPDALVVGVASGVLSAYTGARITLSSKDNTATRCVSVLSTGQVAVELVCP